MRFDEGEVVRPPADWSLLPAGDATLTRRVKQEGATWTVQVKRGRRSFSRGVWARTVTIEEHRAALERERSTESYRKKQVASARRRAEKQGRYEQEFLGAVVAFLDFPLQHELLARRLARAITEHAAAIGSGTVARTQRIPIEQRAEAAVIAWLRHQTTGYDQLRIARVKGRRREVRRALAERSRELLDEYRRGRLVDAERCPLQRGLETWGRDREHE